MNWVYESQTMHQSRTIRVTNYWCASGGVPKNPVGHVFGNTRALKLVPAPGEVYQEGHDVHALLPAVGLIKFLRSQVYYMSYGNCRKEITFENFYLVCVFAALCTSSSARTCHTHIHTHAHKYAHSFTTHTSIRVTQYLREYQCSRY